MKHYIITGPELTMKQYILGREFKKNLPDFKYEDCIFSLNFPETKYGATKTREMLDEYLNSECQIFLATRYEAGVSHMLNNEASRLFGMTQGSVVVLLFRDEDEEEPTVHQLDCNGFLENWPMGILW